MLHVNDHLLVTTATTAIETVNGRETIVSIPPNARLRVLEVRLPNDERLVEVDWGGRTLSAFSEDLAARTIPAPTRTNRSSAGSDH